MESKWAAAFSEAFIDVYPAAFSKRYEAMECLSSTVACETLLVRDRMSGRLLVAKCYEGAHPLYETTEPEALRGLSHPGLPAFVEEICSDRMRCILREYIPGVTLREMRNHGPFPLETIVKVGLELCAILKYLHSRVPPIIHRDIKPQNVVLREDGTLALIDLGISRLYADGAPADTVYCGTRDFAAPEQYGFLQTDCRSDIYALGVLLTWMLTGAAEPIRLPDTRLEHVLAKCTSFSPNDRYRNAAAVARGLKYAGKINGKEWLKLGAACILVGVILLAGTGHGASPPVNLFFPGTVISSQIAFTEPLIEMAVRQTLEKSPDAALSRKELAAIKALYISGGTVCKDMDSFYQVTREWYDTRRRTRGPIDSLEDLKMLPGLETVYIGAEHVHDLSPLAMLPNLKKIDLRFNDVSDLSPLTTFSQLSEVGLNTNPVSDIMPLVACKALRRLDLCDVTGDYDVRDLSKLGDLDFLDISNQGNAYLYLGSRTIRYLKASGLPFTDLSFLRKTVGLQKLEVCHGKLYDLSKLSQHQEITYLRLCDIPAEDYSVLLKLPKLETVVVSTSAKELVAPMAAQGHFTVQYE